MRYINVYANIAYKKYITDRSRLNEKPFFPGTFPYHVSDYVAMWGEPFGFGAASFSPRVTPVVPDLVIPNNQSNLYPIFGNITPIYDYDAAARSGHV